MSILVGAASWTDPTLTNNYEDQGQRNARTLMSPLGGAAVSDGD